MNDHADTVNALHHIAMHLGQPFTHAEAYDVSQHAIAILRRANALQNIHLEACNGIQTPKGARWTEEDQNNNDDRDRRVFARFVEVFAACMGDDRMGRLVIENQGDPRGPAIHVHIKDGPQHVAAFGGPRA